MDKLKDVREKINETDDELKKLFVKRMSLCGEVAKIKKQNGIPVNDTERENAVVYRLTQDLPDNEKIYLKELYSAIFATSKAYQNEITGGASATVEKLKTLTAGGLEKMPARAAVACQGVKGSYGGAAAKKLFPVADITYFKNFEGVFSAVESGLCEYGVLPIENSTAGSVSEVYDLMRKHNFHIVRAIKLKIEHCLVGKAGATAGDIKRVISHPQALRQCDGFIKSRKYVADEAANTAVAAKTVAESDDKTLGALCSYDCAELYGLKVLERSVQDESSNYTRFICIGKNAEIFSGSDKISVMTTLPHRAGSLASALNRFSALGLNLTKIESRPVPNTDFEFMFYFDFEGDVNDASALSMIADLENTSDKFQFLGAYKEIQ